MKTWIVDESTEKDRNQESQGRAVRVGKGAWTVGRGRKETKKKKSEKKDSKEKLPSI